MPTLAQLERGLQDEGMLVELYTKDSPGASAKEIRESVVAAREMIIDMIEAHKNQSENKPTGGKEVAWKTIGRHELPGKEVATIVLHDPIDRAFVHSIRETSQLIVAITDIKPTRRWDDAEEETVEQGELVA